MPVNVTGIKEIQRALKDFDPTLNKTMRKYIRAQMIPVRDKARGYMPSNGEMLSGWTKLAGIIGPMKYRPFPQYDSSIAKSGIVYREGKSKTNQNGFASIFYVENNTAAGKIYEWAGRVHPQGQPWAGKKLRGSHAYSNSNNPNAGKQFIGSLGGQTNLKGSGQSKGRALYRAWAEDNGRVIPAVLKAINYTVAKFDKETQIKKAA